MGFGAILAPAFSGLLDRLFGEKLRAAVASVTAYFEGWLTWSDLVTAIILSTMFCYYGGLLIEWLIEAICNAMQTHRYPGKGVVRFIQILIVGICLPFVFVVSTHIARWNPSTSWKSLVFEPSNAGIPCDLGNRDARVAYQFDSEGAFLGCRMRNTD